MTQPPEWVQSLQLELVQRIVAEFWRWVELKAHPKRPNRTPRRLKKACRNFLAYRTCSPLEPR